MKELIGAALKDSITENDFYYLSIDFVVALLKKKMKYHTFNTI
jgi:hypothetical protein